MTGALIDEQIPAAWRWQGRAVRIVDGTTVTLPDTAANQAAYPQQRAQKPGLGFPICRIVGVTCLASGAVTDAAMGPYKGKGGSEHALLRTLLPRFRTGDILLGDALYGSYTTLAECVARGVDVVFEQNGARKRGTGFRTGTKLGSEDHLVRLRKPLQRPDWMRLAQYQSLPEEIVIRELRIGGKLLITTLHDPAQAPRQALQALYRSRWHVELEYPQYQNDARNAGLELQNPADGREGDVGLPVRLQSDPHHYGPVRRFGQRAAPALELQAYPAAVVGVEPSGRAELRTSPLDATVRVGGGAAGG